MVFLETENIDALFNGIGEQLDEPINEIVTYRKREKARDWALERFTNSVAFFEELCKEKRVDRISEAPAEKREELVGMAGIINYRSNLLSVDYGRGYVKSSDLCLFWDTFPWRNEFIFYPYSELFYTAELLGTVEAIEGQDINMAWEHVSDDIVLVAMLPLERELEIPLTETPAPQIVMGDIEWENCPNCNIPIEVSRCNWNYDTSILTHPDTGRRMAFMTPSTISDAIDDLRTIHGDRIDTMAIDGFRDLEGERMNEGYLPVTFDAVKRWTAFRGLGNVTTFDKDDEGLTVAVENSLIPHFIIGSIVAACDREWGTRSPGYEWAIEENGDLLIGVFR